MLPTTVAHVVTHLCFAARLVDGARDWSWLRAIGSRLAAQSQPLDRFDHLVPGVHTLDLGITLMDQALDPASAGSARRDLQYRDGLIIAILSLFPIRRRSIAALTVERHVVHDDAGISLLLYPVDSKSKRTESFRVPSELVPYFKRYLDDVRPRIVGAHRHNGLWASNKQRPMSGSQIYRMARKRIQAAFGKDMCLHDFRRSAATFTAMDAPKMIGLIPGVLQHASPDVSQKHYNLARGMKASERYNTTMSDLRTALRSKHSTLKG